MERHPHLQRWMRVAIGHVARALGEAYLSDVPKPSVRGNHVQLQNLQTKAPYWINLTSFAQTTVRPTEFYHHVASDVPLASPTEESNLTHCKAHEQQPVEQKTTSGVKSTCDGPRVASNQIWALQKTKSVQDGTPAPWMDIPSAPPRGKQSSVLGGMVQTVWEYLTGLIVRMQQEQQQEQTKALSLVDSMGGCPPAGWVLARTAKVMANTLAVLTHYVNTLKPEMTALKQVSLTFAANQNRHQIQEWHGYCKRICRLPAQSQNLSMVVFMLDARGTFQSRQQYVARLDSHQLPVPPRIPVYDTRAPYEPGQVTDMYLLPSHQPQWTSGLGHSWQWLPVVQFSLEEYLRHKFKHNREKTLLLDKIEFKHSFPVLQKASPGTESDDLPPEHPPVNVGERREALRVCLSEWAEKAAPPTYMKDLHAFLQQLEDEDRSKTLAKVLEPGLDPIEWVTVIAHHLTRYGKVMLWAERRKAAQLENHWFHQLYQDSTQYYTLVDWFVPHQHQDTVCCICFHSVRAGQALIRPNCACQKPMHTECYARQCVYGFRSYVDTKCTSFPVFMFKCGHCQCNVFGQAAGAKYCHGLALDEEYRTFDNGKKKVENRRYCVRTIVEWVDVVKSIWEHWRCLGGAVGHCHLIRKSIDSTTTLKATTPPTSAPTPDPATDEAKVRGGANGVEDAACSRTWYTQYNPMLAHVLWRLTHTMEALRYDTDMKLNHGTWCHDVHLGLFCMTWLESGPACVYGVHDVEHVCAMLNALPSRTDCDRVVCVVAAVVVDYLCVLVENTPCHGTGVWGGDVAAKAVVLLRRIVMDVAWGKYRWAIPHLRVLARRIVWRRMLRMHGEYKSWVSNECVAILAKFTSTRRTPVFLQALQTRNVPKALVVESTTLFSVLRRQHQVCLECGFYKWVLGDPEFDVAFDIRWQSVDVVVFMQDLVDMEGFKKGRVTGAVTNQEINSVLDNPYTRAFMQPGG